MTIRIRLYELTYDQARSLGEWVATLWVCQFLPGVHADFTLDKQPSKE